MYCAAVGLGVAFYSLDENYYIMLTHPCLKLPPDGTIPTWCRPMSICSAFSSFFPAHTLAEKRHVCSSSFRKLAASNLRSTRRFLHFVQDLSRCRSGNPTGRMVDPEGLFSNEPFPPVLCRHSWGPRISSPLSDVVYLNFVYRNDLVTR